MFLKYIYIYKYKYIHTYIIFKYYIYIYINVYFFIWEYGFVECGSPLSEDKIHCVWVLPMACTLWPQHTWKAPNHLLVVLIKLRHGSIHIVSRCWGFITRSMCWGWGWPEWLTRSLFGFGFLRLGRDLFVLGLGRPLVFNSDRKWMTAAQCICKSRRVLQGHEITRWSTPDMLCRYYWMDVII